LNKQAYIGKRLLALRKHYKLSVSELAAKAGVSTGMISQIERDLTNPSIRTLERLRDALGVPLSALLEDESTDRAIRSDFSPIRRAADRPVFHVGRDGLTKELLSPAGDRDLQMMIIELPAGASSVDVLIGDGEKAGLVLEGEVTLEVDGISYQLGLDDSFQFSSQLSHSVRNESDAHAKLIWIMNTKRPTIHL
jgi:transcriptional regulator with XRE-family HTH domain